VFDVQNLITVPNAKLMRRLGSLSGEHMAAVESVLRRWLGL
jgi:mRNA interferase MazF